MEKIESLQHLREVLIKIKETAPEKQSVMLAELGRRCLFFMAWDILGFKDVDPGLHWDMCDQWDMPKRNKLFLCPRGSFKTSIYSISGSIMEITRNKDVRILLTNATLVNAKTILKGIKDHFLFNDRFRTLYPELCPKIDKKSEIRDFGTQDEFRVANQRPGVRESTMEIGAVDGNLVSRHYELHIGDDLVNDKNVTTKEQIDKVENFVKAAVSLLEPGVGRTHLVGTRWHFDDPYGRIIEEQEKKDYHVYIRKILEPDDNGKLKSIFPKRFPKQEIYRIKRSQDDYIFSCQYMNDPLPEESKVFKREWFKTYKEMDSSIKNRLYIVTCIDPAVSLAKRADCSAIVTVGLDHNDDFYVLEYINRRMNPSDLIDNIFMTNEKWNPMDIGVETFAFQKTLKFAIEDEMRRRRIYLPLKELENDNSKSKEARIRSLQPRLQYCNFYIREGMDELLDQFLRFPKSTHDDIIDAIASTQQFLRVPRYVAAKTEYVGETFQSVLKKNIQRKYKMGRIGMNKVSDYA